MASRTEVGDTGLFNILFKRGIKGLCKTVAGIADNYVINANDPPFIFIDPQVAARDVLLPADADSIGLMFVVFNTSDNATSAETITFKTSADGALTPAVDILKSEAALLINDGNGWKGLVGANT